MNILPMYLLIFFKNIFLCLSGESEVIGDLDTEARGDAPVEEMDTEDEGEDREVRPGTVRFARSDARPSIDVMIEELQRQQDQRFGVDQGSSHGVNGQIMSPPPLASPPGQRLNMQSEYLTYIIFNLFCL